VVPLGLLGATEMVYFQSSLVLINSKASNTNSLPVTFFSALGPALNTGLGPCCKFFNRLCSYRQHSKVTPKPILFVGIFVFSCGGVRLTPWYIGRKWAYCTTPGWHRREWNIWWNYDWKRGNEVVGENPASLPFCLLKFLHGIFWVWIRPCRHEIPAS
jgi:hypothetical protein